MQRNFSNLEQNLIAQIVIQDVSPAISGTRRFMRELRQCTELVF